MMYCVACKHSYAQYIMKNELLCYKLLKIYTTSEHYNIDTKHETQDDMTM